MVRHIISSPRDCMRLAAVCKPWHDAASRLPVQPAVPALILSPYGRSKKQHMCGPCGSWVLHVPGKAVKKRFIGSHHGGWIAAMDDHQLVIVNFFSGAEVALTAKQKMIASIPTSSLPGRWMVCTSLARELVLGHSLLQRKTKRPRSWLPIQSRDWSCYNPMYYDAYIVELHGELLIAERERWLSNGKYFFRVFKLVYADNGESHKQKWAHVTNFGEYALFLGLSKAVHVPVGGHHGIKRNHIYYYSPTTEEELPDDKVVYSVRTADERRDIHAQGLYRQSGMQQETGRCMRDSRISWEWVIYTNRLHGSTSSAPSQNRATVATSTCIVHTGVEPDGDCRRGLEYKARYCVFKLSLSLSPYL
uniref:KIB1-4 beta-propeller domain-containing protein n=1 Tax=Aegilops tauschii TaxID=37682 RepID=M8BVK7_AEGTA